MPTTFNVMAQIPFEFIKSSLLVEFQVIAYTNTEAEIIGKGIINDFNKKEDANYVFDKCWKVRGENFVFKKDGKNHTLSDMVKLSPKLKPSTLDLKSWMNYLSSQKLSQEYDYVLKNDFLPYQNKMIHQ